MARKDFFRPGIITLQYINDDEQCVGLVIGDEHAERIKDPNEREMFDLHFDNDSDHEAYVCLVLGYFPNYNDRHKIFGTDKLYRFPTYISASKSTATPSALIGELGMLRCHQEEHLSIGVSRFLGKKMFGFNTQQKETLQIVAIVQHYLSGGSPENIPKWIGYFCDKNIEKIFKELHQVLPRK